MTLLKTVPVGLVIALALGAVLAGGAWDSPLVESRSRADAWRIAQTLPLPQVRTIEANDRAAIKWERKFPLDDLHKLCGYSYAQFEAAVTPRHVREYSKTFGRTVIVGTDRPNFLLGTPNDDLILGFDGVDRIIAQGGDDLVCGGSGADLVFGGSGRDRIDGGPGADYLG